jgi:ribosomal protein S18 acetylase RimI-like enzyme
MANVEIRRLEPREWEGIFSLVAQLRPHLDKEEFLRRVRVQGLGGYELIGAFRDDHLVGFLGIRPVHTLVRGAHLHVDDLVVDEAERKSGVGRALMDYAEADARARGMGSVFLDARSAAIGFYETIGFVMHTSPSMRKDL